MRLAFVHLRHCEEGKARRGNPFLLWAVCGLGAAKGMQIPTTSLRTGLGMIALVSRRVVFNILRGGNRCDWLSSTSVIARRAKPDVAIRFYFGRCVVLVRRKGDADSHDQSADWSRNDSFG